MYFLVTFSATAALSVRVRVGVGIDTGGTITTHARVSSASAVSRGTGVEPQVGCGGRHVHSPFPILEGNKKAKPNCQ